MGLELGEGMNELAQEKIRDNQKKAENELALQDFGRELRRIRKIRGFTQKELWEITGIDDTVISDLERGTYTPSLTLIKELSDGLQINPFILLSAYYGVPLPEFSIRDRETLEGFIKLARNYLSSTGNIHHLPPSNPMLTSPNHEKELTVGDQAADEVIQEQEKETEKTKPKKLPHISGRKKGRPSSNPKD
jgi:transcriptional regulator with XRE-family HTH domain